MSEPEKVERKIEPLGPNSLHTAEHKRVVYFGIAPKGVKPEDLLRPEYWAHVAAGLKPRDRIEINAEDGTWYCEVMVLDSSRAFARVHPIIGPIYFTTADVAQTQIAGYLVDHRAARKWSVIRLSDRVVMSENHETKAGADEWLAKNGEKLKAGQLAPVK